MNHKAKFFVADYSDTTHVYIHLQAASEEVITDVAYAKSRREFAYSSADKLIYIRKFATSVKSWNLLHVLQGMNFRKLILSHIHGLFTIETSSNIIARGQDTRARCRTWFGTTCARCGCQEVTIVP